MNKIAILLSTLLASQIPFNNAINSAQAQPRHPTTIAQATNPEIPTPQVVRQTAKNITVRITSATNGGSGVLIAQKGNTYLVLTNAHVVRRAAQLQIQAPDGQKYIAESINGGFDPKYDLALLQFSSQTKYTLADLSDVASPLALERTIYSAGFPFDAKDIRITSGEVSQLSDLPFDNGTQIGYTIDKGKQGVRQGMSGGAILDGRGKFIGINTISVAPILPNYTYNDGSKPIAKLSAKYRQANWAVPVYNFLTNVKPDILYGFDNLPKIERQVTPTGYLAKLNTKARQMTVRIETGGANGSGVIIAREGNSYYVLTAKHVVQNEKTKQSFTNIQLITYDQERYQLDSTIVAEGVDLAVVKFTSNGNYPLAQLGEYNPKSLDLVFAGGFPGREKINSPLWQWQLNPGFIDEKEFGKFQTQSNQSFSNGYDLIYTSISYGGMSGGPVFDTEGKVIGIHGKAENTNKNTMLGKSLGVSIQTFTGLAAQLQVKPQLLNTAKNSPVALNKSDLDTVTTAMQNIPQPQAGDSGERWLTYGNQLYRTRQFDKSVAAFDRAIAQGEALAGNYAKALSLSDGRNYLLAETAIAKAITLVPTNERTKYYYFWKLQAIIAGGLAKYDEALRITNLAIELEPNDSTLTFMKAGSLLLSQQYAPAIAILDKMISTAPNSYAYYFRGASKYISGDKQGGMADVNRAIQLNPNNEYAYVHRGTHKVSLGDKKGAIADGDRAVEINPNNAETYFLRGNIKLALGDKQGAMADYDRAIKINPNYDDAYVQRGSNKSTVGDKQGAMVDLDRAIKANPNNSEAYAVRGILKISLGDKQGAIADGERAIKINPNSADNYYARGAIKFTLGDKQGAIVDLDRAIKINPSTYSYFARGNAKSSLGNHQGAIGDFDRAIAINPQSAVAYNNRGVAKSDLGNKQGAIADLSKAAELFRQQGQMDLYQQAMGLIAKLKGG